MQSGTLVFTNILPSFLRPHCCLPTKMKVNSLLPLALAITTMAPSLALAAKNVTLSVLTNNVYFLSETLYPNWGQSKERCLALPELWHIRRANPTCCSFSFHCFRWSLSGTRAQLIASSDYIKNHDVVVLQECFDNDPCGMLRDGLRAQCKRQHSFA